MFAAGARPKQAALFDSIGSFLIDQRLAPTPVNYAFAYRVLTEPTGSLAQSVGRLIEDGVRISAAELAALGIAVDAGQPLADMAAPPEADDPAAALVARTQRQVRGFEGMVRAMRDETAGFGRDLAESADALRRTVDGSSLGIADITAAMRHRIELAERRMEQAMRETSELRVALEAARDDARRDALTGLPNRRAFEEAFDGADEAVRHVAICDVDHFKSINDRHGHVVGDRILKAIAATLANACGDHLVARHGGEEFAILMAGCTPAAAHQRIDAARAAVSERRYRLRESDALIADISISAGLVAVRPGEAFADVVQRADALLYAAKADGRNRVFSE